MSLDTVRQEIKRTEREIDVLRTRAEQEKKETESFERKIADLEKDRERHSSALHEIETKINTLDKRRLDKVQDLSRQEEQERLKTQKLQAANDNKNSSGMGRAA